MRSCLAWVAGMDGAAFYTLPGQVGPVELTLNLFWRSSALQRNPSTSDRCRSLISCRPLPPRKRLHGKTGKVRPRGLRCAARSFGRCAASSSCALRTDMPITIQSARALSAQYTRRCIAGVAGDCLITHEHPAAVLSVALSVIVCSQDCKVTYHVCIRLTTAV